MTIRKDRPQHLEGQTTEVATYHGNLYVIVNWNNHNGLPFEIFALLGKAGSCDRAYLEAITRLCSLCLQHDIHPREIVKQLSNISCHPYLVENGEKGNSSPVDAVAKVLGNSYEEKGKQDE